MSDLVKLQWSIKLADGTIVMAQAETVNELVLAKTELETKILKEIIKQAIHILKWEKKFDKQSVKLAEQCRKISNQRSISRRSKKS